jgi:hypothetical protein
MQIDFVVASCSRFHLETLVSSKERRGVGLKE